MSSQPTNSNTKQILVMSLGAVIGGIVLGICGMWVLNPGIMIPIGVVIGLAVTMPMVRKKA
ncbi:hypothetical protein [Pseudonocardia sp. NPDC049635]|uniref:hypothetical protein n=1 Tax=Pseudonocardia sp. NPDC049635 TaxID=3155506 RepID=UPI0033E6A18C